MGFVPKSKKQLFSIYREGYYKLNGEKEDVRNTIYADDEFSHYTEKIDVAFDTWKNKVDKKLRNINKSIEIKDFISVLSKQLISEFANISLVDKYDVYEVLLSYWQQTMADDVFVLKFDGYEAGREIENFTEETEIKKGEKKGEKKIRYIGWGGKLIPKTIIETVFFSTERAKIDEAQAIVDETQNKLDEMIEEHSAEEGVFYNCLNDNNKVDLKAVNAKIKELQNKSAEKEDYEILCAYRELDAKAKKYAKIVKELYVALDQTLKEKYKQLTVAEIKELLVNRKWYYSLFDGIKALYVTTSHNMANRIVELAERYETTLPDLEKETKEYEKKVKSHLERMGFVW